MLSLVGLPTWNGVEGSPRVTVNGVAGVALVASIEYAFPRPPPTYTRLLKTRGVVGDEIDTGVV